MEEKSKGRMGKEIIGCFGERWIMSGRERNKRDNLERTGMGRDGKGGGGYMERSFRCSHEF